MDKLAQIKSDHDEGYCTLDDSAWLIEQAGKVEALKAEVARLTDQLANYDWADRGSFELPDADTAIEVISRLREMEKKQ